MHVTGCRRRRRVERPRRARLRVVVVEAAAAVAGMMGLRANDAMAAWFFCSTRRAASRPGEAIGLSAYPLLVASTAK
uniref:Uncharacterized protein n=1 Tax=Triticum urartu TaxID=4572 RepID=A0A8R7QMH2_TRIUA